MTSTKKKGVDRNTAEEVTATVSKMTRKVSTGCGPSPPRDTPETVSHEEEIQVEDLEVEETLQEDSTPVRKISTSVGTSPPPQCAGTQVSQLHNAQK